MLSKRQKAEIRYNTTQLAEFERISITREDCDNVVGLAEELFRTTGKYDCEDVYFVICEYLKIFS